MNEGIGNHVAGLTDGRAWGGEPPVAVTRKGMILLCLSAAAPSIDFTDGPGMQVVVEVDKIVTEAMAEQRALDAHFAEGLEPVSDERAKIAALIREGSS